MNSLERKLISIFTGLGSDQRNAAATFQVYMELCEVKRMHDVNYYFSKDLQRMYLTAKHSKSAEISIFLPVSTSENISLFEIMDTMHDFDPSKNVYLGLVSPDSTCVYYKLSKGLEEPAKESSMKQVFEKRQKLDNDINTKRNQIEEAAKSHALS